VFDLRTYLPYLLNRVGFAVSESFGAVLETERLTLPMWRVMAVLHHYGAQRISDLAELTSIEMSTLSRLLNGMERRRLTGRKRATGDARAVYVSLTQRGRTLTEKLLPAAVELEERLAGGLEPHDVAALKRILNILYENVRKPQLERPENLCAS
jgi:DNA-binding MarR family transcriptional regulator